MNEFIWQVIDEIECDIEKYKVEKETEIEKDNLARALVLQWAIAGLMRAIGTLSRIDREIVSQETKENDGIIS